METIKAKYRNITTPQEIPFAPGYWLLRKERKIIGVHGSFLKQVHNSSTYILKRGDKEPLFMTFEKICYCIDTGLNPDNINLKGTTIKIEDGRYNTATRWM